jgi:hypothetical protein
MTKLLICYVAQFQLFDYEIDDKVPRKQSGVA